MSAGAPDTPPAEPPNPTPEPGESREQMEARIRAEVKRETEGGAKDADPALSAEQVAEIGNKAADGVIERMQKLGVFDEAEPEPEPSKDPPEPEGKPGEPGEDERPAKKTLAQRFMGH